MPLRRRLAKLGREGFVEVVGVGHGQSGRANWWWQRLTPRGREAGIVHLANFPDGGAGFGAAGLTNWSMTITTGSAQQVGDAAVAVGMLGGGELVALHSSSPAAPIRRLV